MTFLQLQNDVLESLNLTTAASSEPRTRIKRYLNEGYRKVLRESGMNALRDGTTTVSVVAGTDEYAVTAVKIKSLYDTVDDRVLTETSLENIRLWSPDPAATTGDPTHYAVRKTGATTLTIRLYPRPDSNVTLQADITTASTELSSDSDVPVIPEDFHDLLLAYARMREYEKQDDSRQDTARAEYVEGVRQLRYHLVKSHTEVFRQGGTRAPRTSRLGPWFEAGS